jgi:hypothetical protein
VGLDMGLFLVRVGVHPLVCEGACSGGSFFEASQVLMLLGVGHCPT